MTISRDITPHLTNLATQFKVVAVLGPRQSGKSTLVRQTFPHYTYLSLENLDTRLMAKEDPRHFFATYNNHTGVIIDEIQEVPELLSYMQGVVDENPRPGFFIITGSQNFLLHEKATQSLAGRIALLTLLPLTVHELQQAGAPTPSVDQLMLTGFYPQLHAQKVDPKIWAANYISTYIEKDVRQVLNIGDVTSFQKFIKLCAARTGNLLNYADLARDCDISPNTAKAWISVLETSYIIRLITPYHNNFNKRVIKAPKLYFYDTGLVCTLLGIRTAEELQHSPLRGALFESFVISELFKNQFNNGQLPHFYFWRDVQGHEIDCVVEKSFDELIPIEIKARMTITDQFFKELLDWQAITKKKPQQSYIVYAGTQDQQSKHGSIISWQHVRALLDAIYQQS